MEPQKYILDEEEFKALIALRNFAENAFLGYGGKAAETEQRLTESYRWLVMEYLTLLEQTVETLDKYEAYQAKLNSIFHSKN